jgi:hypothetical protein
VGWQPVLREDDQVLTQHRSCVGGAEHAVGLVQAAVSLKFAMTAVGIAPLAILIKTLGRSDVPPSLPRTGTAQTRSRTWWPAR